MTLRRTVAVVLTAGLLLALDGGCCCVEDRPIPWPSVTPTSPTPDCEERPGTGLCPPEPDPPTSGEPSAPPGEEPTPTPPSEDTGGSGGEVPDLPGG